MKMKPFPLPKISDILRKLSGFKYATAIDLSMGYYNIPLDLEAQKLCTTILPWGNLMSFICASVINHDITKVMGH
jgi:hypothetical protein